MEQIAILWIEHIKSIFPFIITFNIMFQILLTTRNVLIANLAFTDLVLCIIAMPLYLADFIFKYWPLRVDMVRAEFYRKEKIKNSLKFCTF